MSSSTMTAPEFLTQVAGNLDKHLLLPVLAFAAANTADATLAAQYAAARATVQGKTGLINADATAEVVAKKTESQAKKTAQLKAACSTATAIFFDEQEDGTATLKVDVDTEEMRRQGRLTASALVQDHKTTSKAIKGLYDYGFHLYDIGTYPEAASVLRVYRSIAEKKDVAERDVSALWGKMACDVMAAKWDAVQADIEDLREELDPAQGTATVQLVWLLHWSLFYYFQKADPAALLEHVFTIERADRDKTFLYTNVIQSAAPHLLRYVAAAAVLNKKKKSQIRRTQRIVEQDAYSYSDALTQFIDELCNKSNFEKATALLPECEAVLAGDFFLAAHKDDFMNKARMMIFEDKLRIHRTLSIPVAAEQLGMTVEKTELWLVNLIREAKLDAKVNSLAGVVSVNVAAHHKTVWQEVLEVAERTAVQQIKH
jgi:translation initiation factor 3 subunit E